MEITKKTTITEAIKQPGVGDVFKKYNLICASCRGAAQDTIDKAALNNAIEIESFLKELNEAVREAAD